jgi:hypothetical protein
MGTRLIDSTPAADGDVHGPGHDGLGREVDGLLGRPALAVDRGAGDGVGEPGGQGGVAGDVHGLLADRHGAAHDHVLDQAGSDRCGPTGRLEGLGGQVGGVPSREAAPSAAHRGPDGIDDDGVRHEGHCGANLTGNQICKL